MAQVPTSEVLDEAVEKKGRWQYYRSNPWNEMRPWASSALEDDKVRFKRENEDPVLREGGLQKFRLVLLNSWSERAPTVEVHFCLPPNVETLPKSLLERPYVIVPERRRPFYKFYHRFDTVQYNTTAAIGLGA